MKLNLPGKILLLICLSLVSAAPAAAETQTPAGNTSDFIDLIFCINTTRDMSADLNAVRASAAKIIDRVFALSPPARVAFVSYREFDPTHVTAGIAFSQNKEQIRQNLLSLQTGKGGDKPEAVYEALLAAIKTKNLKPWRADARKIVILLGKAAPGTKKHTLDDVLAAARAANVHIYPIPLAGMEPETIALFGEIAERTNGIMSNLAVPDELPGIIMKIVELGKLFSDVPTFPGKITQRLGDTIVITVDPNAGILPGMQTLIFRGINAAQIIAEGPVASGKGLEYRVDLRSVFGNEQIRIGCPVRVLQEMHKKPVVIR
jgi:hypothetical protein